MCQTKIYSLFLQKIRHPVLFSYKLAVSATMMECLLISTLNYIQNIIFFLFSFLKYCDFMFFVISIFVVVKKRVVNSKHIFVIFGICSSFFYVFIRAILEQVCQSCNVYNVSPFLFCSFEFIYLSINLPTSNLPTNRLYEVICPSFLKAVLSAKTLPFIKTVCCEIQIQTKALYELYWVV